MSEKISTQSLSEMDTINKCTTKLSYEADWLCESSILYVESSFVKWYLSTDMEFLKALLIGKPSKMKTVKNREDPPK